MRFCDQTKKKAITFSYDDGVTQDMRFIELMPILNSDEFGEAAYVPYSRVLEQLPEAVAIPQDGGVAKLYRLPGAKGNIGLISPVSAHFCGDCNRIRLTADGIPVLIHDGTLDRTSDAAEVFGEEGVMLKKGKKGFRRLILK